MAILPELAQDGAPRKGSNHFHRTRGPDRPVAVAADVRTGRSHFHAGKGGTTPPPRSSRSTADTVLSIPHGPEQGEVPPEAETAAQKRTVYDRSAWRRRGPRLQTR